mmetsp:Transcript_24307/g.49243  ORF Transcript_24307/g.49243 Transcript_24307/m.49243 type:complete len:222 (+) Transcript_24307:241-906(+)
MQCTRLILGAAREASERHINNGLVHARALEGNPSIEFHGQVFNVCFCLAHADPKPRFHGPHVRVEGCNFVLVLRSNHEILDCLHKVLCDSHQTVQSAEGRSDEGNRSYCRWVDWPVHGEFFHPTNSRSRCQCTTMAGAKQSAIMVRRMQSCTWWYSNEADIGGKPSSIHWSPHTSKAFSLVFFLQPHCFRIVPDTFALFRFGLLLHWGWFFRWVIIVMGPQ